MFERIRESGLYWRVGTIRRPGKIRAQDLIFLLVLVGSVGVVLFLRSGSNAEAAKAGDGLFAEHASFVQAKEAAASTNRPVLVFATADWCGPCQSMKATTLADESVQARLQEVAVPYKLDVTDMRQMSDADGALAQSLGVSSIPAFYIVDANGGVRAQTGGLQGKDSFLSWLESATASR